MILKNLPLTGINAFIDDPIATTLTAAQKQKINQVKSVSGCAYTVFDMARTMVYCQEKPSTTQIGSCPQLPLLENCPMQIGVCPEKDKLFWTTFRTLYLTNRKQVMFELRENPPTPCNNLIKKYSFLTFSFQRNSDLTFLRKIC